MIKQVKRYVDAVISGRLNVDQGVKLQTTRFFDTSQNWQSYNEIQCFVNTTGGVNHGIVKLEILGGSRELPSSILQVDLFDTIDEDYNNSILFQLVLKGLGSVSGDSAVEKLKQSILGFNSEY